MKWFAAIAGALLLATSGCAYDGWGGGYDSIDGGYPAYPVGGIGINVGAVSDFYGPLSPYGSWFNDPFYGMVFQPYGLGAGWMPYSLGYWVDTPRYGRMWRSDEPFGWATYHYGRWTQDRNRGWFWVPGTQFTPGAVRWSNNGSNVGWQALAPSRPGRGSMLSGKENRWIYAPRARLGSPDLSRYTTHGGTPGRVSGGQAPTGQVPAGQIPTGAAGRPGWMASTNRSPGVTAPARTPQATRTPTWRHNGEGMTFDRNQPLSDRLPTRQPNAPFARPQDTDRWQGRAPDTPRAIPDPGNGGAWNGRRGAQDGSWGRGGSRPAWGGGGYGGARDGGGGGHRR